jgi:hypothetical protein
VVLGGAASRRSSPGARQFLGQVIFVGEDILSALKNIFKFFFRRGHSTLVPPSAKDHFFVDFFVDKFWTLPYISAKR